MKKENAINAIKFLDRIEIKGHQEREAMNQLASELLEYANTPETKPEPDPDGKTDPE